MAPAAPTVSGRPAIRDFIAAEIANSKKDGITVKSGEIIGVGASGETGWLGGTWSVTDASGSTVDTRRNAFRVCACRLKRKSGVG
jgi:hypothetical protein